LPKWGIAPASLSALCLIEIFAAGCGRQNHNPINCSHDWFQCRNRCEQKHKLHSHGLGHLRAGQDTSNFAPQWHEHTGLEIYFLTAIIGIGLRMKLLCCQATSITCIVRCRTTALVTHFDQGKFARRRVGYKSHLVRSRLVQVLILTNASQPLLPLFPYFLISL
jgi:hypothetical protein